MFYFNSHLVSFVFKLSHVFLALRFVSSYSKAMYLPFELVHSHVRVLLHDATTIKQLKVMNVRLIIKIQLLLHPANYLVQYIQVKHRHLCSRNLLYQPGCIY